MERVKELRMTWKKDLDGSLAAIWHEVPRQLDRRRTGVKRPSLLILLLLFIPNAAMPQRYGRPYGLAEIPQLLLRVSVQKKTHYFSVYDLQKMPRSVVTETNLRTKQTHVYEGVDLGQLVAITTLNSGSETVEIEFGSHQTQTIPGIDLDTRTTLIVADTVDGKPISQNVPYDLVTVFHGRPTLVLNNVRSISVKHVSSPARELVLGSSSCPASAGNEESVHPLR